MLEGERQREAEDTIPQYAKLDSDNTVCETGDQTGGLIESRSR